MGLTPVPDDQIATIVTSLEMRRKPPLRPTPTSPLRLVHWPAPDSDKYKALFRRIGEPWLWFSRLVRPEAELRRTLDDPKIEVYAAIDRAGIEVGFIELDFRTEGVCGIGYFGLVPELIGKGHGGWLMAQTLALAWRRGVTRVWLHTCTLDHPSALGFYRHHGFVPYKRTVESFADPRIAGILAPEAAPHVPMLGSVRR
ncbi:GNAT family N-acetyltransferase [Sphingomonas sp. HF-S4]|uniref:GNAT family N-acetyltransferase n=1 Tax=Sphingomonas agrestis TaxID=3080540 RepID=A0ABU3Y328_9SPHN|nr:GNAT family N-acetyltransferase [Sphingomonas sp. HF-S4]MDV3455487.1 GNAT family N-acetyltransferase [Sphingomonas sp. HF-S4]